MLDLSRNPNYSEWIKLAGRAVVSHMSGRIDGERRLYREMVSEASSVLGGVPHLASRLKVPVNIVERWSAGDVEPPPNVFLESLEIIAEAPWRGAPAFEVR